MANIKIFFLSLYLLKFSLSSLKFNIPKYRDKCFQEEIFVEGTILIRYDLIGFENFIEKDHIKEAYRNIRIFIKDKNGNNIFERRLETRKDKFAILIKIPDKYYICARYDRPRRGMELPMSVLLDIKIRTDYQYSSLDLSLHKSDVESFQKSLTKIKNDVRQPLEASKKEIEEEDKTATDIIFSVNTYYKLCILQLVVILVLTLNNILYYKDFIKSKLL